MKKKVIFFMPSIEGGGVEKNLFLISKYLSSRLKLGIITADNHSKKKFDKKVEYISPKSNFFYKKKKYFKYFICLMLLLREFYYNKNICIFSFQANIYAILLAKILRIKIISRSNTSPDGWSNNFIKVWIFKNILNLADLVIVNSRVFKIQMKKKFKVNCKLILNPLNKSEIIKKSKKKTNIKFFTRQSLNIINVARLTDQKDHITLLNSISELSKKINIRLLILGSGYNKSKIIDFIKKNNLNRIIKLLKFQTNPYKYMRKADIFVLSSRFEGLPNVLLEAMTLKKFIISSNCPTGPREILKNGKFGFLFKVGSHTQLNNKIYQFINQRKKTNFMIQDGFKNLDKYDYKSKCEAYHTCIKNYLLN